MQIAGSQGSSTQVISQVTGAKKGSNGTDCASAGFLSSIKEVAESVMGRIVAASSSKAGEADFRKEQFYYEDEMPDSPESVYDFIAEIRDILREAKKR